MATWYRRYRALYNFEARSDTELSMSSGETLTVTQLANGSWPPPEKWMQGYNEVTNRTGEFPGGAYVEFIEEFVIEPEPPPPPPPELEPRSQAPPLPPQPSPRHMNSQKGFQLPGMVSRGHGSQSDNDIATYRDSSPQFAADDLEETPPPPPPRKGSDSHISRGSLPIPPKPQPRAKKISVVQEGSNRAPALNTMAEDRHTWVRVTFGLPVQCEACKLFYMSGAHPLPSHPLPYPSPPLPFPLPEVPAVYSPKVCSVFELPHNI